MTGSAFSRACWLCGTIQDFMSRLATEQTQVIIYMLLSFLLGQLSFRVQFSSKVWFCRLGFQSFLWLSGFWAGGLGIVTGVGLSWFGRVVGRVVRSVVRRRGLGFLLVWRARILFPRTFLYMFPVSGVNILGLLPELGKHVRLSVPFTDFIFETSRKSLVKPVLQSGLSPRTANCQWVEADKVFWDALGVFHLEICQLVLDVGGLVKRTKIILYFINK